MRLEPQPRPREITQLYAQPARKHSITKKKKKVLSRDLNKDSSCKWETKEVTDTFPHPLSSPTHVPHTCDTCACMSHGEMYSHTRVLQLKMNINCVSVWLRLIQTWNANAWNHGRLSLLEMEAGRFRVWVCEADFPLWILTLIIKKKKKEERRVWCNEMPTVSDIIPLYITINKGAEGFNMKEDAIHFLCPHWAYLSCHHDLSSCVSPSLCEKLLSHFHRKSPVAVSNY